MDVPGWLWAATIVGLLGIIVLDLLLVDSKPGEFGPKQATRWVVFYIALAIAFGIFIYMAFGAAKAGEFFAGYITEYSLSVDNLFVFIVIMASFAVPRIHQHRVLLVGVLIALILRGILIVVGAAALQRFSFTFYLFGALLILTAVKLLRGGEDDDSEAGNNIVVRTVERFFPTTREYHGSALTAVVDGRRVLTPMLLVMVAIGTTDVLFALDSIPAIFGLTQEAYLVFAANAFALMGLRQLYFLVSGLLERLVFLSIGLAVILGFIGVKLILHAINETTDLHVPEISIVQSLAVIIGVLAITTVASLLYVRTHPGLVTPGASALRSQSLRHEAEALESLGDDRGGERAPASDD
ncbi:MAG: TerC family protein [Candidatus Nanopelagicales bacterium]